MLAKERQSAMREIIRRDGRATIADLARRFDVTTETVRRDLSLLSQKEPIRRIHGGAVLLPPVLHEYDLEERKLSFPNEKRAIGALAASLLSDGDSVAIGEGSTTAAVAEAIFGRKDLLVTTCSLEIASLLHRKIKRGDFTGTVVMLGGVVEPRIGCVIGGDCFAMLDRMYFNKAFFGATAISERGVLLWDNAEAQFTSRLLSHAETRVCVAESEKFGKNSYFLHSEFGEIDRIVTDATVPIPEPILRAIKQAGAELSFAALPDKTI